MTMTLDGFQARFLAALLGRGGDADLEGQAAFAVYRNTVQGGCVDALEANFPAVARLVGPAWFRAAAVAYVREQPPHDGRLLFYGEGFADFLAGFAPARELPYLPGVARLDRRWIEAHTAADAPAAGAGDLSGLSPQALGALRLSPHPAARWNWFADAPVRTIWERNRAPGDPGLGEIVWRGEGALLTRPDEAVVWQPAAPSDCAFLDACARGDVLAEAAAAALDADAGADIADLLARLLRAGALVPASPDEGNTP
jgi:hypothetical protein